MTASLRRMRTRQAIVLLISVLLPVAVILALHAYHDGPIEYGPIVFLLLIGIAAIAQAWRLRYRMDTVPFGMAVEPIRASERYRKALKGALVMVTIIGVCWLLAWSNHAMPEAWWAPLPYASTVLIYIIHVLISDSRLVLTEAGLAERQFVAETKRQREGPANKFLEWLLAQGWMRYPWAGLLLYVAYEISRDATPGGTFWAVVVAAFALYLVRDVFLVVVVLAVVGLIAWAIFGAVAALPVSVAIIIGAIIIAGALRSK